jgi:hypothetical protein
MPYGYGWDYLDTVHGDIANVAAGPGGPFKLQCDEYPYASTREGGGIGAAGAIINCIYKDENQGHGSLLGVLEGRIGNGGLMEMHIINFPFPLVTGYGTNNVGFSCPLIAWTGMYSDALARTNGYVSWLG